MAHIARDRACLLTRVRRIKGQVAALEQQINAGEECGEVLQQIAAVRGAINGLLADVLEGHITEHMAGGASSGRDREALAAVLRRYLK